MTSSTISERDLRRMLDAVSPDAENSPGPEMPQEVLRAISDLIPASSINYYEFDPATARGRVMQCFAFRPFPPDTDMTHDLFAKAYWECTARSNPLVSGKYVTGWRDFYTEGAFNKLLMSHYLRTMDYWHDLIVCLPSRPGRTRRLLLARDRGDVPFSERDRLVLTLLRPHLAEIRDRVEAKAASTSPLTARQLELLRYVASGLTNHQISRRLGVSDGTVRKHLENIYARLDAHSRTEAVARAGLLLTS